MAHAEHSAGEHASGHDHPPVWHYIAVFWFLIAFLLLTVGAAVVDLGKWNLTVAIVIAVAKVAAIMAIFMHLKYTTNLVRFFALIAFGFLVILFVFTLADYFSRGAWGM